MQELTERLNSKLDRYLSEKRLFLRSDTGTRFIRLRPLTQLGAIAGSGLFLIWAVIATSILLMDSIGSGTLREQAKRDQYLYEARLNTLSAERDQRAEEAASAQERFSVALDRISEMQSTLLQSEERRKELETGIEVIQATLRRTVQERDAARAEIENLTVALYGETGTSRTDADRASDLEAALEFLAGALDRTADERDLLNAIALQTQQEADHIALEKRLLEDRTNLILARLESAVEVSMEPLERVFRSAGLPPEQILRQVRSGMVRPEDRLTPLSISTSGTLMEDTDAERVNAILSGLERVNMYRIASQRVPFAQPVTANVRFTSGFGNRRDPKTGRTRMHSGVDFAGSSGTPIRSTADGVVKTAGWQGGYGNAVVIEHAFGVETLYAHLSRINVSAGQRVSRGDVIGGMGTTGRSTGVHLHYEVRVGGSAVNPMSYIRAAQNVF